MRRQALAGARPRCARLTDNAPERPRGVVRPRRRRASRPVGGAPIRPPPHAPSARYVRVGASPFLPRFGCCAPLAPYLVPVVSWALRGGCGWRSGGLHAALPATTCLPLACGVPRAAHPAPLLPRSYRRALLLALGLAQSLFMFVDDRCNPPLSITAV